ncbi:MAG: radical SAM family heme chaperone HemW [Planctomycetota bacterium]
MHIPYCVSKCRYCDFNSYAGSGHDTSKYVDSLCTEIRARVRSSPPTIFMGGGTPTYLSTKDIETLLSTLADVGALGEHLQEFTVEANPESATKEKLTLLLSSGVDRLSLGVQSFDPAYLKMFDRVHSVDEVAAAVVAARESGFTRLNLDLIFAKPNEPLAHWMNDLECAIALNPDHLSCYELAFEEGTTLRRDLLNGRVDEQTEEARWQFFVDTIARNAGAGFYQYETSAFSKPGQMCLHNLVYWTSGNWIGVGAGAANSFDRTKSSNIKNPEAYIKSIQETGNAIDINTVETVDSHIRLGEIMMMGMRLLGGLRIDMIRGKAAGASMLQFEAEVERLIGDGLLSIENGWLCPTPRGRDLGNVVASRFLKLH